MKIAPTRRKKITVQRSHDDDEALKPHTDIRSDRDDEHHDQVGAEFLKPVELWDKHIAREHGPVSPKVWAERAVDKGEALIQIAAVPGNEELGDIGITDDGARGENDLV